MANGDVTLTNYGTHSVSGASLATTISSINLLTHVQSGSQIWIIPIENGQVQVLKTAVAGW